MEVDPPYLFDAGESTDPAVSLTRDLDTAVIELTVRGRWSRRTGLDVYHALRKCLAEHPAAIIVDLRELSDLDGASASMWLAGSRAAGALQPPVQLVLSIPPTRQLAGRLRRLGAVRYLPIFVTLHQARAAVAGRMPLTDRLHLRRLPAETASVGTAADLVGVACDAWSLPLLLDSSRRVMSELVTNAVDHAGTELAVTVSRRGAGIYLSVHDGDPRLPHLLEPVSTRAGPAPHQAGGGLRMVHDRASAWGAMPSHNGKVVWAIVRSGQYAVARPAAQLGAPAPNQE